jgi:uncharacterized membrane protein (DUF4010 family)
LAPVLLVGAAVLAAMYFRHRRERSREAAEQPESPLGFWTAIRMAILFQAVLLLVPLVNKLWGATGVLASAAVLGLTDMDALTYSMTQLDRGADSAALGAEAIAVGVLSNTVLKLTVALAIGRGEFRKVAGLGLVGLGAASGVGLWLASVFR